MPVVFLDPRSTRCVGDTTGTPVEHKTLQWNAELYQGSSSLQFQLGLRAIEKLGPLGHERILDLGCGNGLLTIELARRLPSGHVTGIEVSSEMAALARQNIERLGVTNVDVVNMDALEMEYRDDFDALFSNSAIHWIRDLQAMYRLIFRSLKPGGRIIVQTGLREPSALVDTIRAVLQVEEYWPYYRNAEWPWRFLTREENADLLAGSGFTGITVERYVHNYMFRDLHELSNYFESAPMVPFMTRLPDDRKDGFRDLFIRTYLARNNHVLSVSSARVNIAAAKPR
ncbi:MAG: methyltransferase domain-containing protein [Spirochaetes bacterium]|nr:methyltransferase domain-containing protein [Spirochaetota bacterium]